VIKPLGVLLVLSVVLLLIFFLFLTLWRALRCIRSRKPKTAVVLGIVAMGIAVFCAWATYAVAPKGAQTIAELESPDGRAFIIRNYRYGWLEYRKVYFYSRNIEGVWTSFRLISELVNPNTVSFVLNESAREVEVPGVGCYLIQENSFVNIDGSGGTSRQLPPGVKPGEEDIY